MAPDDPRWLRLLGRLASRWISEEALGDIAEEYAAGERTAFWLIRQIVSSVPRQSAHAIVPQKGRPGMLSTAWSDVRYVLRTLHRNPGFAVAAIAPIALGIGITTGTFSVFNNLLYRPLPVPTSNELLTVYQDFRGGPKRRVHGARAMFSLPEYRTYRDASSTLSGLAAHSMSWTVTLGGPSPQELEGVLVSCNYFDVLRLRPEIGTGFTPANCDDASAPPSVVLSYALWKNTFSGDRSILQKPIALNGQNVAVVGVAPKGFEGTELARSTFFASLSLLATLNPDGNYLEAPQVSWLALLARRRQDTGIDQVRAELAVVANQIDRQQPGRATSLIVSPATTLSLPGSRRDFVQLATSVLGAFGLILLIACANVANVLLARGAARSRELAVRLAIGARRARLVQLLMIESATIALLGGVSGTLVAWWAFQALMPSLLSSLPGIPAPRLDVSPNVTVLWFGLAVTALTAVASGLVPALRASNQELRTAMKQDAGPSKDRSGRWLRGALLGVQAAVCMVLLVSAGLLLRGLHAAYTVDPGFEYQRVAVVSIPLRGPQYSDGGAEAFTKQLGERIGGLPGVLGVAQTSKVPLSRGHHQTAFRLPQEQQTYDADMNSVSPEFFSLLGVPIVSGRTFTRAELSAPIRAVIVTQATARRFWPGQNPVGRTIVMDRETVEVVGIAKDAQVSRIGSTESSFLYLPALASSPRLNLLVKTDLPFAALGPSLRRTIESLDGALVPEIRPLESNVEFWRAGSRALAVLSACLSALGVSLAALGVYGVVSYLVARRRREVGIRVTLGASPLALQALLLRETLRPVSVGLFAGLAGAAAVSRVLESTLFGVSPLDPIAFVGAALFLLIVAATATLVPTRQVLRIDPMTALRHD